MKTFYFTVAILCTTQVLAAINIEKVNEFPMNQAAFAFPTTQFPGSNRSVFFTTFGVIGNDNVFVAADGASLLTNNSPNLTVINSYAKWPNWAAMVPSSVAQFPHPTVLTAGGFLAGFGKTTGAINVFDLSSSPLSAVTVSTPKKNYFYHRVEWMDVDGDGLDDMVSARAMKPIFGSPGAELVWLKNPGSDSGEWTEEVITDGPGVNFILEDLNNDGVPEVIAAQFFKTAGLYIHYCLERTWAKCISDGSIKTVTIDDESGTFFNVQYIDLNNDGKQDILATTNAGDGSGAVYGYSLPAHFETGNFTRHKLADGYKPKKWMPGAGAPGTATAFHLSSELSPSSSFKHANSSKPVIVVSADDGGVVDLLIPQAPEDPTDWTYNKQQVCSASSTIGQVAVSDLNMDGNMDLVVPVYSENKVSVFTIKA